MNRLRIWLAEWLVKNTDRAVYKRRHGKKRTVGQIVEAKRGVGI